MSVTGFVIQFELVIMSKEIWREIGVRDEKWDCLVISGNDVSL